MVYENAENEPEGNLTVLFVLKLTGLTLDEAVEELEADVRETAECWVVANELAKVVLEAGWRPPMMLKA